MCSGVTPIRQPPFSDRRRQVAAGLLALLTAACGGNGADPPQALRADREHLRLVGSSTIHPFSARVAERLAATREDAAPEVLATGSRGGLALFCAGGALDTPDIVNASRRMRSSELAMCQANDAGPVSELRIGFDGIVLAHRRTDTQWNLSRRQLTLALARRVPRNGELVANPYDNWRQIDPALPDRPIRVHGPPPTSGTRDVFEAQVMAPAARRIDGYSGAYTDIRRDGRYITAGENDARIVQTLLDDPEAFGIFGFSFLYANRQRLAAARVDGIAATRDNIRSGTYPVSRSLYLYVKQGHLAHIPAMRNFVDLYLSESMLGERGALRAMGLIPPSPDQRAALRRQWREWVPLRAGDLAD